MAKAYKEMVRTIGELLDIERQRRGITSTVLAAKLGVTQPTVSRWLKGNDTPNDDRVDALAAFLNLPPDDVVRALHAQRTSRPTVEVRVAALESQVADLKRTLERLVGELEAPPPGQQVDGTRPRRPRSDRVTR